VRARRTTLAALFAVWISVPALAGAQTGTISGQVMDGFTGGVIRGAQVRLAGTDFAARSDLDGRFVLQVPAGTYRLVASLEGYFSNELEALEVVTGTERVVDVVLVGEQMAASEVVLVTAPSIQAASQAAMLIERRSAATVSNSISAQEISGNGDSDAASAMSRVVGASLVDDKYLVVRGLGDRFMSTTQLNGSLLPTTEADRKVVPLDLFPANLIDSIRLEKTFTPDRPGEFSGALVSIDTVEFPSTPTLRVSMSQGYNSLTTGKDFMTYPGGRYDWLGFGDGRRDTPSIIPPDRLALFSPTTGRGYTAAELEAFGESFENVWNPVMQTAIPNQSFNVLAGNTWGDFGVVYGLTYGNKFQNQQSAQNYYRISGGEVTPWHNYSMTTSSNTVRLGSTLNFAYKLNENHKVLLKNFFTKDASDEVRTYTGYNDDFGTDLFDQRLRFVEETIYSSQLAGEHFLGGVNGLLEWRVAYSRADRDEPDIREALYLFNEATGTFRLRDQSQSGLRQFIAATDKILEPGVDFTKFFEIGRNFGSLKVGALYTQRDRFFYSRRFRFHRINSGGIDLSQDPETLFSEQYIGPNFQIQEDTRATDHYLGAQDVRAAYGMVDIFFGSKWRLIGGLRVEDSIQSLNSFDLFAVDPTAIETRLTDTDYLPGVNLVYSITPQQNLRAAYSRTLSRPNFRELAPFDFTDVTGGSTIVGNSELVRTRIDNYDLRWEYFPGSTELISASFFYKHFTDPIETIMQPTAQIRQTFENVEGARNWGIETEVRKGLSGLATSLQPFTVSANYTFISSEVEIGEVFLSILTSTKRPLAGQSRNVFNGSVEYSNPRWWGHTSRVLYNMIGRRITGVGSLGLPDVFQEGQHLVDIVVQQNLSETSPLDLTFSIGNILDHNRRYTQGGQPYHVFREGRTYSIGLSYRFY
jgi:TonB-dependent receptor